MEDSPCIALGGESIIRLFPQPKNTHYGQVPGVALPPLTREWPIFDLGLQQAGATPPSE